MRTYIAPMNLWGTLERLHQEHFIIERLRMLLSNPLVRHLGPERVQELTDLLLEHRSSMAHTRSEWGYGSRLLREGLAYLNRIEFQAEEMDLPEIVQHSEQAIIAISVIRQIFSNVDSAESPDAYLLGCDGGEADGTVGTTTSI